MESRAVLKRSPVYGLIKNTCLARDASLMLKGAPMQTLMLMTYDTHELPGVAVRDLLYCCCSSRVGPGRQVQQ